MGRKNRSMRQSPLFIQKEALETWISVLWRRHIFSNQHLCWNSVWLKPLHLSEDEPQRYHELQQQEKSQSFSFVTYYALKQYFLWKGYGTELCNKPYQQVGILYMKCRLSYVWECSLRQHLNLCGAGNRWILFPPGTSIIKSDCNWN